MRLLRCALLPAALAACTAPAPERPAAPAPATFVPAAPHPAPPPEPAITPEPIPVPPTPPEPPPLQAGPDRYSVPMRFAEDHGDVESTKGIRAIDLDAHTATLLMRTDGVWRSHGAGDPHPITLEPMSMPHPPDLFERHAAMDAAATSVTLDPIPGRTEVAIDLPVHWLDSRIVALGGKLYGLAARTKKPKGLTLIEIDPTTSTMRPIDLPGRLPIEIYPAAGRLILHSARGSKTSVARLDPITATISDEVELPRPARKLELLCRADPDIEPALAVAPDGRHVFLDLGCPARD